MGQVVDTAPAFEPLRPTRKKWPWIVAAMVAISAIVGGVFASRVIAVTRTAYADVMPPDTVAFVHFDFLRIAQNDRIERLIEAFEEVSSSESDVSFSLEDGLEDLDTQMFDELGFTMSDDIMPWIGRGMGMGLLDVEMGDTAVDIPNVEWIAAFDVRNSAALDEFMPKLEEAISVEIGEYGLTTYEGVSIRTWESDGVEWAVAPGDKVLFVGSGPDAIRRAITAQAATSLSDVAGFESATEQLPDDRFFTFYVSGDEYTRVLEDVMDDAGLAVDELGFPFELNTFESASFSATLNDNGFKFDGFTVMRPEGMEPWMVEAWNNNPERFIEGLPADTHVYAGTRNGPGLYVDAYLGVFAGTDPLMQEEVDLMREDFRREFGFDVLDDFLSLLDGETAWILAGDPGSPLIDEFGPFALTGIVSTSDETTLRRSVDSLVGYYRDQAGLDFPEVNLERATGNDELWQFSEDDVEVVFGVTDGVLLVSTDEQTVGRMLDRQGDLLVDTDTYAAARAALPDDVSIRFYLDVHSLVEHAMEEMGSEDARQAEEILRNVSVIAGGAGGDERIRHWSAVMVIDY